MLKTAGGLAMKVGFIGIGSMGAAMVPNLVNAGHQVSVWNRNPTAAQALRGVTVLESPVAAFQNEAVVTMLSDDKAVRGVIFESGALNSARAGCVHVMTSTISLALVDELVEKHRAANISYVAAPVFGVPAAAAKALLNIVVAGEAGAIAKIQPLLDVLGQKTWPLGSEPRHANVAKIAGNMMITLAIEAMGEASALTESHGVKAADFLNIITNTLFASPSYQRYGGFIASNTYEPGFKLTLGLKDVNLAFEAAKEKNVVLPAAEIVRDNMQTAIAQGLGSKDWSILAKIARRRAGLDEKSA
jgi:3-hydroxyisobutyrate dehydrogenase-like beta-hydroxyacid dehydrogenase